MESHENGEKKKEEIQGISRTNTKLSDFIDVSIVEDELIDRSHRKKRFLDFLRAHPSKDWFLQSGFVGRLTPFTFLRRNPARRQGCANDQDPSSSSASTIATLRRRRFRVPYARKINWQFIIQYCKKWVRHPMNMALLVWLFFVAAGLVVLFLLMTGILNGAIPNSSQRTKWTEITNQILNALFTIMCLYQHPRLFHHLVILCRWKASDAAELRSIYCKGPQPRPHERAHLAFVIALLHLTCLAQYVYCSLYWGFTSKTRPDLVVNIFIGIGIASPIIAFVYTVFGPLARKPKLDSKPELGVATEEESQKQQLGEETAIKVYEGRVVVTEPQWIGGLFDCGDDLTASYLSFFCTFCVFGWNMERLGFGNMYVHIVTFVLFCIAPLSVFYVAALNISNDTLKYTIGIAGIVLCFFGLLYGGFWRTQMRKKFKLPANPLCFGYPAVTDCMQWLFCWWCSLAQEVRTGNFYEIEEDSFYSKQVEKEGQQQVLVPLPREGEAGPMIRTSFDSSVRSRSSSAEAGGLSPSESMRMAADGSVEFLSISIEEDQMMSPPIPPLIQIEDQQLRKS